MARCDFGALRSGARSATRTIEDGPIQRDRVEPLPSLVVGRR